ncbi:unnamed protein product [Commensalibacter communis]|nr:unnamed protein product [Commensalibacter communis]CAI3955726.1 unnamed protein product [Commensalibacter communis]
MYVLKMIYISFCILLPNAAMVRDHTLRTNNAILTTIENFILAIICRQRLNNATQAIKNAIKINQYMNQQKKNVRLQIMRFTIYQIISKNVPISSVIPILSILPFLKNRQSISDYLTFRKRALTSDLTHNKSSNIILLFLP